MRGAHGSIYLVNAQLAWVARLSDCRLPRPLPGLAWPLGASVGRPWRPGRFWEESVRLTRRCVMRMGVGKGSHGLAWQSHGMPFCARGLGGKHMLTAYRHVIPAAVPGGSLELPWGAWWTLRGPSGDLGGSLGGCLGFLGSLASLPCVRAGFRVLPAGSFGASWGRSFGCKIRLRGAFRLLCWPALQSQLAMHCVSHIC